MIQEKVVSNLIINTIMHRSLRSMHRSDLPSCVRSIGEFLDIIGSESLFKRWFGQFGGYRKYNYCILSKSNQFLE